MKLSDFHVHLKCVSTFDFFAIMIVEIMFIGHIFSEIIMELKKIIKDERIVLIIT